MAWGGAGNLVPVRPAGSVNAKRQGPREQRVKGSKLLSGRFLRIGGILKERCSDGSSQAMWRHKEGGGAGADGRGRWRWHWLGKKRGNRSEKRTRDVMGWHRGVGWGTDHGNRAFEGKKTDGWQSG